MCVSLPQNKQPCKGLWQVELEPSLRGHGIVCFLGQRLLRHLDCIGDFRGKINY